MMTMMDEWNSEYFIECLNAGDYDDNLIEVMGDLSTEQLTDVANVLRAKDRAHLN